MCDRLIYFVFLLILFASCEEYYTPTIDKIDGQLVVEAQITNDATKSFVHLTRTRDFYSKLPAETVAGAKVELVEINGSVATGNENITGYFTFNTTPVTGKNYKLRITIGKDTYESETVTMPPVPIISNFYTEHKEEKVYRTDGYGIPSAYTVQGREIYIEAPVTSALSHYRFYTRSVIEWSFNPPSVFGPPPPTIYGWKSFYQNANFNLTGPKKFSAATDMIEKQPLLMLSYNAGEYINTDTLVTHGWIIIVDQYGTSAGSFDYHQKLNSQFAADGSLFDPIQTQIYGNITCKTDPSKIVFGYFDLNSYQQIRYYMYLSSPQASVPLRQLFRYPFIPDEGQTVGSPPAWFE